MKIGNEHELIMQQTQGTLHLLEKLGKCATYHSQNNHIVLTEAPVYLLPPH